VLNDWSAMKPPIFIIGNPRSGTTLLRLMLTCHRNIVIPPECGFVIWWYDKYKNWNSDFTEQQLEEYLDDLFYSKKIETWHLQRELLRQFLLEKKIDTYSALVSSIYEFFAKQQKKSFKRWGDKNNFHLKHIETIFRLFPEARFIHIIRDGRDVACSYKNLSKMKSKSMYAPKLPAGISEIAKEWTENIKRIRKSFEKIGWDKVIEIRYEDLVTVPEQTLKSVCTFLKEHYDSSMLDFYILNKEKELEPMEFLKWKGKILEKVTASQIQKYKKCLSMKELRIFNSIATDVVTIYKYFQLCNPK